MSVIVVSIAAGISIAAIAQGLGPEPRRVVRVMPNTPALLGKGASAYCLGPHARPEDEATVRLGHEFATAAGAEILHEPRLWPEYGPDYYAVFIRDPAGNNLELKCQASTGRPTLST